MISLSQLVASLDDQRLSPKALVEASCFSDVFRAEQAASMEQAGISPASQACVLEAADFDLLTSSMADQVPSDDVAAQLMLSMMSALTECFTDEELQQIGMGTPADQ